MSSLTRARIPSCGPTWMAQPSPRGPTSSPSMWGQWCLVLRVEEKKMRGRWSWARHGGEKCSHGVVRRSQPKPANILLSDFRQGTAERCPSASPGDASLSPLSLPGTQPWTAGDTCSQEAGACAWRWGGPSPQADLTHRALLPRPDTGLPRALAVAPSSPCASGCLRCPSLFPDLQGELLGEQTVSDVVLPYRGPWACQIGHPNQG